MRLLKSYRALNALSPISYVYFVLCFSDHLNNNHFNNSKFKSSSLQTQGFKIGTEQTYNALR